MMNRQLETLHLATSGHNTVIMPHDTPKPIETALDIEPPQIPIAEHGQNRPQNTRKPYTGYNAKAERTPKYTTHLQKAILFFVHGSSQVYRM